MSEETKWMDEGSCHGADPALFFPGRSEFPNQQYQAARMMCNGCPVRQECLDYAVAEGITQSWTGIWGGMSPKERRRIERGQPAVVRRCSCGRVIPQGIGRSSQKCSVCKAAA